MRKRNAKFRQKHPDGLVWTLNPLVVSQDYSQAEADRIVAHVRNALDAMLNGRATHQDYAALGAAINVAAVRSEGASNEHIAEGIVLEGATALEEAMRIRNAHGRYGLTGPGRLRLENAIDLWECILRASTPLQMLQAEEIVTRRLAHMNRRPATA